MFPAARCATPASGEFGSRLDVAEEGRRVRPHRGQLAPHEAADPQAVVGRQPFRRVLVADCGLASPCEGLGRLRRAIAARRDQRVAVGDVQSLPLARARRLPARRLVRHRDRLAEMGDRLLEGRAAQGLVARLAPPFDREIVEPGLR